MIKICIKARISLLFSTMMGAAFFFFCYALEKGVVGVGARPLSGKCAKRNV